MKAKEGTDASEEGWEGEETDIHLPKALLY